MLFYKSRMLTASKVVRIFIVFHITLLAFGNMNYVTFYTKEGRKLHFPYFLEYKEVYYASDSFVKFMVIQGMFYVILDFRMSPRSCLI